MLATKLRAATAAAAPEGAWDLAYAYYNPPAGLAGNISTAKLNSSLNIDAIQGGPAGVFLKPDLLTMYIIGNTGDNIDQWSLPTPGVMTGASYVQSFSVGSQETTPQGLFFKPDGLKMYVIGFTGDDVNEYTLSTAWDISTASYVQAFSVATQEITPTDVFFKPDGLKMYVIGSSGDDVNEYTLSTAWDISTASYLQNFSVAAQETSPQGLSFSLDGTKMYVFGSSGDDVNEYTLSTAWDISTASYVRLFDVGTSFTTAGGIFITELGGNMFLTGTYNDGVSTIAYVRSYALGGFSVATQETTPQGLFFKSDGLKMYVIGSVGDDVNEYTLSTAWDISTASYLQNFSVAAQDTGPTDLFFKPDGTKMYVMGGGNDSVYEYTLSTAWNISTASYVQTFSVATQDISPQSLFFKPDGLKMYVLGSANDSVYEYTLSTAWDISTASYLQDFSVLAEESVPQGLFFKPDGTGFYISGNTNDSIYHYSLGVQE